MISDWSEGGRYSLSSRDWAQFTPSPYLTSVLGLLVLRPDFVFLLKSLSHMISLVQVLYRFCLDFDLLLLWLLREGRRSSRLEVGSSWICVRDSSAPLEDIAHTIDNFIDLSIHLLVHSNTIKRSLQVHLHLHLLEKWKMRSVTSETFCKISFSLPFTLNKYSFYFLIRNRKSWN